MANDCIFCKIAHGEIGGPLLYHDEHISAFRDINPVAPTHILIIPNRHLDSINQVSEEDNLLVARMMAVAKELAEKEGVSESGYRLIINTGPNAGQAVPHLHLHMVAGRKMSWPPG
jgi:histidine triad (HIT) family protein